MKKILAIIVFSSGLFAGSISDTSMYIATGILPNYINVRMEAITNQVNQINSDYESGTLEQTNYKNKKLLEIQKLETLILIEMKNIRFNQLKINQEDSVQKNQSKQKDIIK